MSRRFTTLATTTSIAALLTLVAAPTPAGIATTVHNLSVSGPGTRKATSESEICLFCHVPHNASPAGQLWSRRTGTGYTPYSSSTLKSVPGQPNGASLLCLSCHDGTIALGEVVTRASVIAMAGGVLAGNPLLGTNLADDHPVSFVFDAALATARGELTNPATLVKPSKVRLDGGGRLQCTSCHDPHDNAVGKFLTTSNVTSALCQTCHIKNYWTNSDHRNSVKTWNGLGTPPWPHTAETTVAANACENCHRPHTAGGAKRLLNFALEEDNCYSCHDANVAAKNIVPEFSKIYRHTVAATTAVHDPVETAVVNAPARHVECVDCHNPHATNGTTPAYVNGVLQAVPGSMIGVRGVNLAGAEVNPSSYEYQICFRCHGDSSGMPAPYTGRQIVQNNKRLEFQTGNPSYHPVAGAGKSATMPSLAGMTLYGVGLTAASIIKCTDCHNNDAGPNNGAGGTGPNGPHGSINRALLERNYATADNTTESITAYALCYKCHNRTNILSGALGSFTEHNLHVVGQRAPCNVCHDPHGVSSTQGNATNNARLINFQTGIVTASAGRLRWERTGTNTGRCYLVCHGKDHNPLSY